MFFFFFCSVDSFHSSLSKSFPPFISWPNSRAFESKNTPANSDVTPADITPLQSSWSAGFIIENLPFLCIDCSPLIVFLKVPEGRVVQGAVRSVSSCPGVSVGSSFGSDFSCWWRTHRFLLSLKKQSAVKCLRRWWIFREYCWMQELITAPLTQYRYTEGKNPKINASSSRSLGFYCFVQHSNIWNHLQCHHSIFLLLNSVFDIFLKSLIMIFQAWKCCSFCVGWIIFRTR